MLDDTKETIDLPTVVTARVRDVAEPVTDIDDDEEEEEEEEDAKLITFGPLPNEEPPASAIILDFICNASFVPYACQGCFHDDAVEWERVAYTMEHKNKRKQRKSRIKKAPFAPTAMVVSVRDGGDGTDTDTSVDSQSLSTASRSTGSSTAGRSSSGGGSPGKRWHELQPQLPPRFPSHRRYSSQLSRESSSSTLPIVIGEQRDDVEASKGRNRYKEQLSAVAAAGKKKFRAGRRSRSTPISYTINVKGYSPARDAPSETPTEAPKEAPDPKDDDTSDVGDKYSVTDKESEEKDSGPALTTRGSF